MTKFFTCSILTLFLCIKVTYGQGLDKDSLLQTTAAAHNTIDYFNKAIGTQSRLANGQSYNGYRATIDGSAYFPEDKLLRKGTVVYDGYRFENVPLLYDIYKDLLITTTVDGFLQLSLVSERVSAFTILDHKHVYINTGSDSTSIPFKSGFFEEVYKGKTEVLVKRSTSLQQASGTRDLRKYFLLRVQCFFKKDNKYYKITNEGSFLKLYKEQKAELKKLLRSNSIKFNKDQISALKLLAAHIDNTPN